MDSLSAGYLPPRQFKVSQLCNIIDTRTPKHSICEKTEQFLDENVPDSGPTKLREIRVHLQNKDFGNIEFQTVANKGVYICADPVILWPRGNKLYFKLVLDQTRDYYITASFANPEVHVLKCTPNVVRKSIFEFQTSCWFNNNDNDKNKNCCGKPAVKHLRWLKITLTAPQQNSVVVLLPFKQKENPAQSQNDIPHPIQSTYHTQQQNSPVQVQNGIPHPIQSTNHTQQYRSNPAQVQNVILCPIQSTNHTQQQNRNNPAQVQNSIPHPIQSTNHTQQQNRSNPAQAQNVIPHPIQYTNHTQQQYPHSSLSPLNREIREKEQNIIPHPIQYTNHTQQQYPHSSLSPLNGEITEKEQNNIIPHPIQYTNHTQQQYPHSSWSLHGEITEKEQNVIPHSIQYTNHTQQQYPHSSWSLHGEITEKEQNVIPHSIQYTNHTQQQYPHSSLSPLNREITEKVQNVISHPIQYTNHTQQQYPHSSLSPLNREITENTEIPKITKIDPVIRDEYDFERIHVISGKRISYSFILIHSEFMEEIGIPNRMILATLTDMIFFKILFHLKPGYYNIYLKKNEGYTNPLDYEVVSSKMKDNTNPLYNEVENTDSKMEDNTNTNSLYNEVEKADSKMDNCDNNSIDTIALYTNLFNLEHIRSPILLSFLVKVAQNYQIDNNLLYLMKYGCCPKESVFLDMEIVCRLDGEGANALYIAVDGGHIEVVKILVKHNVPMVTLHNGDNALHLAAEDNSLDLLEPIFSIIPERDQKTFLTQRNKENKTPLDCALHSNAQQAVEWLRNKMNCIDSDGGSNKEHKMSKNCEISDSNTTHHPQSAIEKDTVHQVISNTIRAGDIEREGSNATCSTEKVFLQKRNKTINHQITSTGDTKGEGNDVSSTGNKTQPLNRTPDQQRSTNFKKKPHKLSNLSKILILLSIITLLILIGILFGDSIPPYTPKNTASIDVAKNFLTLYPSLFYNQQPQLQNLLQSNKLQECEVTSDSNIALSIISSLGPYSKYDPQHLQSKLQILAQNHIVKIHFNDINDWLWIEKLITKLNKLEFSGDVVLIIHTKHVSDKMINKISYKNMFILVEESYNEWISIHSTSIIERVRWEILMKLLLQLYQEQNELRLIIQQQQLHYHHQPKNVNTFEPLVQLIEQVHSFHLQTQHHTNIITATCKTYPHVDNYQVKILLDKLNLFHTVVTQDFFLPYQKSNLTHQQHIISSFLISKLNLFVDGINKISGLHLEYPYFHLPSKNGIWSTFVNKWEENIDILCMQIQDQLQYENSDVDMKKMQLEYDSFSNKVTEMEQILSCKGEDQCLHTIGNRYSDLYNMYYKNNNTLQDNFVLFDVEGIPLEVNFPLQIELGSAWYEYMWNNLTIKDWQPTISLSIVNILSNTESPLESNDAVESNRSSYHAIPSNNTMESTSVPTVSGIIMKLSTTNHFLVK